MLLVQYPSSAKMFEMITNPEYIAISVHRDAALEDSRLIMLTGLSAKL